MFNFLTQPWPWYVTGLVLGLSVPLLLLLGNKKLGISSSLRHVCASCFPAKIPFFTYDWKKEIWNLFFVVGILFGGVLAGNVFSNGESAAISDATKADLTELGVTEFSGLLPAEFFSFHGIILLIVGGFLVGFGTRFAGGCTSGHTIMGLSNLQWPSLLATVGFFIGGLISTHLLLPLIFP
jgi:uncharacterized membrane protein YedE/YeeE